MAPIAESEFSPLGGEIDLAIESVAVLIDDIGAFRETARVVANRLGSESMGDLRKRVHRPTEAPLGFGFEERGLGGWLAIWQFAIFEILFHFREQAIPLLREVAFGEYDWTQANAIEVLCRLAAEGIDRERTLGDLQRAMPKMRDTALLYIAGPLASSARTNRSIAAIVDELRCVPEFQEALDELDQAAETKPQ